MGFFDFLNKKQVQLPQGIFGFLSGQSSPTMKDKDTLAAYRGWVYSCTNAIAENVANMDFSLYRKKNDGTAVEITNHIALDLLYNVNPTMSSSDLFIITQSYLELNGNNFWYLPRGSVTSKPSEIWVLDPTRMIIVKDPVIFVKGYVYMTPAGKQIPIEKNEIIHFKRFNPLDEYRGIGTVMAAAMAIDIDNYSQIYNKNFFFNSAVPSAALETAGNLTDEQYRRLKTEWEVRYKGLDNAHKLAILTGGLTYKSISPTAREMQFLEQRRFSRDEILGIFRVPKTILGITDDVNRANAEASEYVFAKRVIEPRMQFLIDRLNEFYLPLFGDDSLFFDFISPVPENEERELLERQSSVNKWRTVNEIRSEDGLDPINNGDTIFIDLNSVPLGSVQDNTSNQELSVKKTYDDETKDRIEKRVNTLLAEVKKRTPRFTKIYKKIGQTVADNISGKSKSILKGPLDDLLRAAMGGAFSEVIESLSSEIGDTVGTTFQLGGISGVLRVDPERTFDLKNPRAVSWLSDHALESAKTVEETIEEKVKEIITDGVSQGMSVDEMSRLVKDYYDTNSKWMAERLVRTETAKGYSEGNLEGYRQLDVQMKKWITAGDDQVDPDCLANESDGEIPIDATFTSGDMAPPVHPNCRCDILPVIVTDAKIYISKRVYEKAEMELNIKAKEIKDQIELFHSETLKKSEEIMKQAGLTAKEIIKTAQAEAVNERSAIIGELDNLKGKALDIVYGTKDSS